MAATSIRTLLSALGFTMVFVSAASAQNLTIQESIVVDYRSVVARIEASDTATARSRLQGVVTRLSIDEGDQVKAGEVVAVVVDATLEPQLAALGSRADGLKSQIRQAEEDVARNEKLLADGFYPKARLDEQRTALDVSRRTLAAAEAERRALVARQSEGSIRAPADARVTSVDVVNGAIVSAGEVLARFATLTDIVRLSLPERHASEISEGGTVTLRLPARDGSVRTATIIKIYPELRNGALIADATVQGGLDALVGERVDVLVSVGERRAIRVPDKYVSTRFGVDFVRVKVGDRFVEAPVAIAGPSQGGEIEVLSGLRIGDVIEPRETTT